MKNILDGINSRLDTAGGKTGKFEDVAIKMIQMTYRKNLKQANTQKTDPKKKKEFQDILQMSQYVCVIGVFEEKDIEGSADKIFKEIMVNTYPNLVKNINPQIQTAQET